MFRGIGLDDPALVTPTARTIAFESMGPGVVTIKLSHSTAGAVHVCLRPNPGGKICGDATATTLRGRTNAAGTVPWVVSLVNNTPAESPSVDLRVTFRSSAPSVTLDGLRFQGTGSPGYNGVSAQFVVGNGTVSATGSWSGSHPWRAALLDAASGETIASDTGTGNSLQLSTPVAAGTDQLTLQNTEQFAEQEVFLHAVISWP